MDQHKIVSGTLSKSPPIKFSNAHVQSQAYCIQVNSLNLGTEGKIRKQLLNMDKFLVQFDLSYLYRPEPYN